MLSIERFGQTANLAHAITHADSLLIRRCDGARAERDMPLRPEPGIPGRYGIDERAFESR